MPKHKSKDRARSKGKGDMSSDGNRLPASRKDAAVYIVDLAAELSVIAAAHDLPTIAVLLTLAEKEARTIVEKEAPPH